MHILTGLIKCERCGKNYNYKNNNGTNLYICQSRKNSGVAKCDAPIIKENYLIDIIQHHCRNHDKEFAISKIKLFVKEIKVYDESIKIIYRDGTISQLTDNEIIF